MHLATGHLHAHNALATALHACLLRCDNKACSLAVHTTDDNGIVVGHLAGLELHLKGKGVGGVAAGLLQWIEVHYGLGTVLVSQVGAYPSVTSVGEAGHGRLDVAIAPLVSVGIVVGAAVGGEL